MIVIILENKMIILEFMIQPEAVEYLKNIRSKLGVISIIGKARTGKSFLLNRVLLNKKDAFVVGSTVNPCTKGLWIWP